MRRHAAILSILLIGFVVACNSDVRYVLVTVSDVPLETVFLRERAAQDFAGPVQLGSPTELEFDLRRTPPSDPGTFSFVLSPQPWSHVGASLGFVSSVAAFDASGCLLGVGNNRFSPALLPYSSDVSTVALSIKLRRFSRPDCTGTRDLVLHDATPSTGDVCPATAADASPCLCVIGWGFHPYSQLAWNGLRLNPIFMTQWVSAASMTICKVSPPFSGSLRITNPDGQAAELDNVAF